MAEHTEIAWCDSTFNPWIGCTKVSPGCDNCYAAAQDKFRSWTPQGWGAGNPRKRTSEALWHGPVAWNSKPFYQCNACGNRFGAGPNHKVDDEGFVACPRCRGTSLRDARRRIFCASLADVFDNEVSPEWRADLFRLIADTPNLDWLLLTKRIGNAKTMMADALHLVAEANRDGMIWPLPNVWLGATIVNQEEADRDIPKLLATPARVRFLSCEPLLGPVNVRPYFWSGDASGPLPGVDWIIVGGESGHGARLTHPAWIRGLRDQCAAAGTAFMFKQHGEWVWVRDTECEETKRGMWVRPDGTTHDGTALEAFTPDGADALMWHVGKKAAGRLLDGVEHNGFPEVSHG